MCPSGSSQSGLSLFCDGLWERLPTKNSKPWRSEELPLWEAPCQSESRGILRAGLQHQCPFTKVAQLSEVRPDLGKEKPLQAAHVDRFSFLCEPSTTRMSGFGVELNKHLCFPFLLKLLLKLQG